jgi:O-antigen/teichoic acid export membrane protein
MPVTLKDKAAKGLFWSAFNSGTIQLLNAVFGIILARRLTQDDYGLIGMLMIFALVANSLQDSGFVTALTNRRDATHKDFNSVFWFNVIMSFMMYVLFFFLAPLIAAFYNEPLLTSLSRYYFLGFFIASFSIVPRAILFRQIRQKPLAIIGVVALLISGTVGIIMAYNDLAYWGLATQTILFNLTVSVLSWIVSGWRPSFTVTFQPIREMFSFSSKMLITNIFNQINNNIFALVIGKLYTKTEVGLYSQANKWNMMGAQTIIGMVQGVAQPTFVQVGDDKDRLCHSFSKMLRFTCFVCFPVMFGLSLIAPEFIVILITDKWLPSALLMRILCVGGAFLPISTLYFNMLIARGKSNIYMWNIICQGLVMLASIIAIHYLAGNVRDMVIVYACILALWVLVWQYFVWREIGFRLLQAFKDILPFGFLAAATMITTYFLTDSIQNIYWLLISRILLAMVIYLAVLWLLKAKILRESIIYIFKRKL